MAHAFASDLADEVELGGPDARHLGVVRRLRPGEVITVADGSGRWRPYVVRRADGRALLLEAHGGVVVEPELRPRVEVAFALLKAGRPDLVVQKLGELGVDAVIPFRAERSVVRWDEERGTAAVIRWRAIAREAAMQSHRARVLEVEAVGTFAEVARRPGAFIAAVPGHGTAGMDALARSGQDCLLAVIGPEGGFSQQERAEMAELPQISLAPHVLRSETAAVTAGALLTGLRWSEWCS